MKRKSIGLIALLFALVFLVLILFFSAEITGLVTEDVVARSVDSVFTEQLNLENRLLPGDKYTDKKTLLTVKVLDSHVLQQPIIVNEVESKIALANSLVEWEMRINTFSGSPPIEINFPEDSRDKKILSLEKEKIEFFSGSITGNAVKKFYNLLIGKNENRVIIENPRGEYVLSFKTDPVMQSEILTNTGEKIILLKNTGNIEIPNMLVVIGLNGIDYEKIRVFTSEGDIVTPSFLDSSMDGKFDSLVFQVSVPKHGKGSFRVAEFEQATVSIVGERYEQITKDAVYLSPLKDTTVGIPPGCVEEDFGCTLFDECRVSSDLLALKSGEINAFFKERTCFSDGSSSECPVSFFTDKQPCAPGERKEVIVRAKEIPFDLEPGIEGLRAVDLFTEANKKIAELSLSDKELNIYFTQE